MINDDEREALVKEAAEAIKDVRFNSTLPHAHRGGPMWTDVDLARAALVVFEEALGEVSVIPTDADEVNSEREALAGIVAHELGPDDYASPTDVADVILAAGFRRSEVPEPSAECPQPCEHLSQHDAREGRTCPEHPCTCTEPQGEPSDARVKAAAEAMTAYERDLDRRRGDESQRIWGHRGAFVAEFHPTQEGRARAALRAAMSLREGGAR